MLKKSPGTRTSAGQGPTHCDMSRWPPPPAPAPGLLTRSPAETPATPSRLSQPQSLRTLPLGSPSFFLSTPVPHCPGQVPTGAGTHLHPGRWTERWMKACPAQSHLQLGTLSSALLQPPLLQAPPPAPVPCPALLLPHPACTGTLLVAPDSPFGCTLVLVILN